MKIEQEVSRFKMELLRKMPFYGDILMRLPFVENKRIPTARTDGRKIEYNPSFLSSMSAGERNFVLMHELFHVLLFHSKRNRERNSKLWNTACDMVVNDMLLRLRGNMHSAGIAFQQPKTGVFAPIQTGEAVENVYQRLLEINKNMRKNARTVFVPSNRWNKESEEVKIPDDIVSEGEIDEAELEEGNFDLTLEIRGGMTGEEQGLSEQALLSLIRESAAKNRSSMGSYFVPEQFFHLTESRHIRWQTLLRNFFTEEISDDASYTTPERKYIHMDLILPGHCLDNERLEEIWAFVDCSGSVGKDEMEQFLTQLYRICKEFKCILNLCYWDTEIHEVYRKIKKEDDLLNCPPHHSGGTDINCVYEWMNSVDVKPDVKLVLTDGYFGELTSPFYRPSMRKKTILVLSGDITESDDLKKVGKITRL